MQQRDQQQSLTMRDTTNFLTALVNAHAAAILPFMRYSFGPEALAWPGFFALLLILAVAGFNGSVSMLVYLCVWLGAIAFQRLYTLQLVWRGFVWHSRSSGFPALGTAFTFGNARAAVLVAEPLLCVAAGAFFINLGEELVGRFLLCGTVSLLVREGIQRTIDRRRLQAMRNAEIEQAWIAREYRNQGY